MAEQVSEFTKVATQHLLSVLDGEPSAAKLNGALRHLAKWRTALLENTLVAQSGEVVLNGPFKGMLYNVKASEGSRTARLMGVYEASLSPVIEKIIAKGYALVIDVGSAEGYYAVGLSRRMPEAKVMARDASEAAQRLCQRLVTANGVQDRVEIGGLMSHDDFAICRTQPTVVICDIEGAEFDLLDPIAAPGLCHADILVEVHEGMRPGLLQTLQDRFAATHRIHPIGRKIDGSGLPGWTETLSDLDRLLLLWEWRASPTPWLWMEQK